MKFEVGEWYPLNEYLRAPAKLPGLYILSCLLNGKEYVGKSTGLRRRLRDHSRASDDRMAIHLAIRKYGIKNFKFKIYLLCDAKEAMSLEKVLIEERRCISPLGYNLTEGGEGACGSKWSEQQRAAMSQFFTGRKNPAVGVANSRRVVSEETRALMSSVRKNRKLSDETKAKMSKTKLGKALSENTKIKISLSRKGIKLSEEHKKLLSTKSKEAKTYLYAVAAWSKKICIRFKGVSREFKSVKDLADYLGICADSVPDWVSGDVMFPGSKWENIEGELVKIAKYATKAGKVDGRQILSYL